MTCAPINSLIICGGGLASWMSAAALSQNLPPTIQITVIDTPHIDAADIFYGTVTNPSAYSFFLNLGLTEADLVQRTQSSFSYGTQYENWGLTGASWVQCFHNPFPNWNGVPFAHHISAKNQNLEHYLVSAQAAIEGKFAHPPADKNIALSSAEYGYHVKVSDITQIMKKLAVTRGVKCVSQDISSVESLGGNITGLILDNGEKLSADLYIDSSGPKAQLISALETAGLNVSRKLAALYSEHDSAQLGPPLRRVSSHDFGWQSVTPLQGVDAVMTVFEAKSEEDARHAHPSETPSHCEISLGHRNKAWSGNCVALGHAAAVTEPSSPAPIMLLQMDIERLMGLIPVTADFSIEAKIFNESYRTDVENIGLFNAALYPLEGLSQTPYWSAAKSEGMTTKLNRKLKQFLSRGLLVSYDLEPFNNEDWTILHHGIGRTPQRKDTFAALSDPEKISQKLRNKAKSIQEIVAKMPPHHIYMAKFLNYLERNHVSEL